MNFLGRILIGALLCGVACQSPAAEPPLHAVLIGGGPDLDHNGAEIESHLKFVLQMLPKDCNRFLHFTDGKPKSKTVSFTDSSKSSLGKRAMEVLLPNDDFGPDYESRAPNLGAKVQGAAQREPFRESLGKVSKSAAKTPAPVLMFFAGHGSRNSRNEENNYFDLWDNQYLYVSNLAAEIDHLPKEAPLVLVMVQCYSGAFANVLFRHADPGNELVDRDIVGFFAATKDRQAAGCGTEIHQPDYQDFSSYFFGALSGRDKLGSPLSETDFDGDGKVNLHEAFCYALIHDRSGDTPNCTSDAFLKRFCPLPDSDLYATPYAKILATATQAQRAALESLSRQLGLDGEARLLAAYDRLNFRDPIASTESQRDSFESGEQLNNLRQEILAPLFSRYPALRWSKSGAYDEAAEKAIAELNGDAALCQRLLETEATYNRASTAMDNEEAYLLRFTSVCANVIRTAWVRADGYNSVKARLEKLLTAEQRILPLK